jgi:integrase/recombinase XerD
MIGEDPYSLQKIVGHYGICVTRKYIRMSNADVRKQHNFMSFP